MNRLVDQLIQALRTELQEYGALLDILNQKLHAIRHGDSDRYMELGVILDNQISVVGAARSIRERLVEAVGRRMGYAAQGSLQNILPVLPENVRGLLNALVLERSALALRASRSLHDCHRLLAHCVQTNRLADAAA